MDRDLLRQCLTYHGESLFNKLKCEQKENPDFQAVVSDLCKATYQSRSEDKSNPLVEQFIARKADILFSPAWKTATLQEEEHEEEEATEPYAIMPPVELFMEVSYEERRSMMYRDLERGDIVVGRINNIREYGFFLTLLCMAGGLKRDIEDLELSALCHVREIPSSGSHDDPLSYYQIGDFIRAGVKDIDRYQEKITVSLHQASLPSSLKHIKLGVVTREELPIHYSRSVRAASETYECILTSCHGYQNPSVVDYLLEKVGVSDTHPPSMMRGLQSKLFLEEDFASAIRKKQSAQWALKCVRAGVDHFKHGRHVDAMNEYNKALEIDTNNVEALVARGALYANKGSIMKAITDFELALESCPDHRNAKKYLCQTLVERGKQLEEQEKLVTAEGLYRRALSLDESNPEAQEALHKITDTIQKSIRLREEALAKEQVKPKSSQTSADKLRKILKEEKRMKKKRKRSASSSSSSSTSSRSSSSSSSSSSRRRSKKKKKKRRRSERGSKRHRRISSRESRRSEEGKSDKDRKEKEEDEVEWYPAPPNTSATFLNQRGVLGFGVRDGGGAEEKDAEDRRISQLYSLSAASEEEESDSSRRERKRGDREESRKRKDSLSRGPEREERRSRSREKREKSRERGKEDNRRDKRDSDFKRRSSVDENRKLSSSSAEAEYSWKSSSRSEYLGNSGSASKHLENRARHDSSTRSSFDGGRYENRGRQENRDVDEANREDSRKFRAEDESSSSDRGHDRKSESAGNHSEQNSVRPRKDVPANLLDIFNQIAQFEKEKGVKLKK
ncbi:tetratricopeptide repeat protein 14 isoform X1 [Acanthochromis polyacanthus]|uniref:tetratricopeptide repeat protein 14 isoform X1 n=1 Tax=Acanthochromis polyacanthus TaxID=80966 RepID=UPI0022342423|nr:tetratricopeptide repeat protein 14 isoform X1 [Acanthochromis polyacanthus]